MCVFLVYNNYNLIRTTKYVPMKRCFIISYHKRVDVFDSDDARRVPPECGRDDATVKHNIIVCTRYAYIMLL